MVVSLPKEAIEYLAISEGTNVSVDLDREGHRILITLVEKPGEIAGIDAEFARQVADFIELYRPALQALANK